MRRGIFALLSILVLMFLLLGCSNKTQVMDEEVTKQEDRIQIGVTFESYVIERWQRDRDVFASTANELGADVNVQTASGSLEEQIGQIEYFIDKGMDVIVIIAADSDSLAQTVQAAKDKGIKVIAYDRLIKDANVDLYISIDSEVVGRLMAEAVTNRIPNDGKISVILGPQTDYNVKLLEKGIESVLNKTNIEVIYKDYAEGWLAEEGFTAVNETLSMTKRIDGIICGNDDLANQSIRALSEHRQAGKVTVVGQDADLIACQRIVEGVQTMTVYKPIEKLAALAAEYAVKLGMGEDISTDCTVFDDTYEVPCVKLEPIAVTKDNIDEVIIGSGFHLKEDVYLNSNK